MTTTSPTRPRTATCATCGTERAMHGGKAGTNCPPCARILAEQRAAQRRAALIEDLEWMLQTGEHPSRIVVRLGVANARSLERTLRRFGRHDLAAHFLEVGVCESCGWPVHRGSRICTPCRKTRGGF